MATTNISTLGITGVDGKVPVYEPNARWCIWNFNEIFMENSPGAGRYVPKVNDFVTEMQDDNTFITYVVKAIDAVTLYPNLAVVRPNGMSFDLTGTDILFGTGPGTQSDTYRVYLDTSVIPHVLSVDARLKIGGSMSSYAKIYLGADTSETGTVISRMYDASGVFMSNNIPLELIAIDSHTNYAWKCVSVGYTNLELDDGELVTCVIHNAEGHVVSKRQLLIENTAFIRQADDSIKYITGISLDSPFISASQDSIIEFPLNVPVSAMNLVGTVHYSNGDKLSLPVDGTKFKLFGLDQYVSSIIGQKIDLVLSYSLANEEAAYGNVVSTNKAITAAYTLKTVDPNNSYTVKLFGYPVWVDEANGYLMKWYLFNLDRNVYYEVTNYVEFAENTGSFNPKGYGYLQRKAVKINLRAVSGSFKPFIHTQVVDINLFGIPNQRQTAWTMMNEIGDDKTAFGAGLYAVASYTAGGVTTLNIKSGFASYADWLKHFYTYSYPLTDPYREVNVPEPTHFELIYNNSKVVFTVAKWDDDLFTGLKIPLGSTVFIRFYKWTTTGEMNLSVSAVRVTS